MIYSFAVSLLHFSFWYQRPPSMAPSSIEVNGEDLIIQPPIENLSVYPLFRFNSLRDGQHAPCTVVEAEVCFLV